MLLLVDNGINFHSSALIRTAFLGTGGKKAEESEESLDV